MKGAKRLFVLIVSIALSFALFAFAAVGCGSDDVHSTPFAITDFVTYVDGIGLPVTADSQADIEGGYIIYEHLNDSYKTNAEVVRAKAALDGYKAEFDVKKAERDKQEADAAKTTARKKFETAAAAVPSADSVTVADKAQVAAALALYSALDDDTKNIKAVKLACDKLLEAQTRIAVIEYEAELAAQQELARRFTDGVGELDLDEIDAKSLSTLENLKYIYESMAEETRTFEGVPEAYAKLQQAYVAYKTAKDEDDVKKYLNYVKGITPASGVTLADKDTLLNAEYLYEDMSEEARSAAKVPAAYEVMIAARQRYDVLFAAAEAERIQLFIAAAGRVPANIEDVDITWFDVLDAAGEAYSDLTYESQQLPEVEQAFERWDAAQTAFDKLGFKRIPLVNPVLQYSGDNPPFIILQYHDKMLDPLKEFFNVSTLAALDSHCRLMLNVYVGDEYVGKARIMFAGLINEGHILHNTAVQAALREIAASVPTLTSGTAMAFELSVEDEAHTYIPSAHSSRTPVKNYTF